MTERKFTRPDEAPEGHEWQTVDGKKVTLHRHLDDHAQNPVSGKIIFKGGYTYDGGWSIDGQYLRDRPSYNDLIDAPEVVEGWLNVYDYATSQRSCLHKTRERADQYACHNRFACIPVKCTKGEGL